MLFIITIGITSAILGIISYASFYYKSQFFGKTIWRANTNNKFIAITFDDGPNQPWTLKIAELFEQYHGHATFFVVGKNCQRFPGVVKQLKRKGHLIGNHSYSHAFSKYIVDPMYINEIAKTEQILKEQGITTKYFRFPWLYRNPWLLKSITKQGYKVPINGQFAHILEPFQINHKHIVKNVLKIAKPGAIIIFHDGYNAKTANKQQTYLAVKELLSILHKQGYHFVTVQKLIRIL
jgi:peptidoglycan/xylan/chitin deacetylase (PgdA/CDA1 family)